MQDPFRPERERMVREQIEARGIRAPEVLQALRALPRHLFLPEHRWGEAYADHPVPLAPGATLSQPYIVALMLEALGAVRGRRVLEVGSGCGYVLALLASMGAKAFGIEWDPVLAARSRATLSELRLHAEIAEGDGARGWPEGGAFGALLISCAVPSLPKALQKQLDPDAVAVFPEGQASGPQILIRLEAGRRTELCPVAFVGLRQ